MNILFVSALLPYPLYSGGQVRIYNLLRELGKRHTITLCSFIRNDEERQYAKQLPFVSDVRMVMRGKGRQLKYFVKALGKYPMLLATYDNRQMRQAIREEVTKKQYDLVHIEPFYVFPSLPPITIPLVVSEHNIEYDIYQKNADTMKMPFVHQYAKFDALKVKIWEEVVWNRARVVTAVSEDDAAVISKSTKKKTPVVSNGVDCSTFAYNAHTFTKGPTCLFVGNFLWPPNVEAVQRLLTTMWPNIVSAFPDAHLTIVGKHFPEQFKKYCNNSISLEPLVERITDAFSKADILLAPMGIGGGTKFKIIEAMATGTLVITTAAGRMGLSGTSKTEFLEAESAQEFIDALRWVYANPKKAQGMTKRARTLVEQTYDWKAIANTLDMVWRNAV